MATTKKTLVIVGTKKKPLANTKEVMDKFMKTISTPRINKTSNIARNPLKKKSV